MAGRDDYLTRGGSVTTPTIPVVSSGASGIAPAGGMDLTALTNYINGLNLSAQTAANRARTPQNAALETQSSANIASELSGAVPPDVIRLLQQQAAERGTASGVGGMSPNNNAAYLRALGLTSIGQMEQGQADLSAADARNPGAPLFNPSTQLITPYDAASLQQQQQFEQDRVALEQQRLALDAAHAGGGGPRGGGGGGVNGALPTDGGFQNEYVAPSLASGTYLPPTNATQSWWNSIGFNPNTATGSSTGGNITIGSDYLDPSLFENVGDTNAPAGTTSTATGSTGGGVDWASLFSPNLGFDASLYSGG